MFKLSHRSLDRLTGVHPDLVAVVHRAIEMTPVDFMVVEGLRTLPRQQALFRQGATRTLKSRHLTGHAVDLAPWVGGTARWDWPLFHPMADAMKEAAASLGVELVWGGDWRTFVDGPHFELDRHQYPA